MTGNYPHQFAALAGLPTVQPAQDFDDNYNWIVGVNAVNLLYYIPLALQANVLNGTGTVDLTAYYQAAQAAAGVARAVVVVPSGAALYFTSPITIGDASATTAHGLICFGRAVITFNISGNGSPCITMKGYGTTSSPAPPTIAGRETLPCIFQGFDVNFQNTGLDGLWVGQGQNHIIHDLALTGAYRNGITFSPDSSTEIENADVQNVNVAQSGQNGIMFWVQYTAGNINISQFRNIGIHGFGANSVTLGVNKTTQPLQLGCAVYALMSATGANIDGISFKGVEIDAENIKAFNNSSQVNPNPFMFANGQSSHVIWGAGVVSASTSFGDWSLSDIISEDTSASQTVTTGTMVNVEPGASVIITGGGYLGGGNYATTNMITGAANVPFYRTIGNILTIPTGTPAEVVLSDTANLVTVRDNTNAQVGLFLYDPGTIGLRTLTTSLGTLSVSNSSGTLQISAGSGTVVASVGVSVLV